MGWKAEHISTMKRVRKWTTRLDMAFCSRSWGAEFVSSSYLGSLVVELDNLIIDSLRDYSVGFLQSEQARGTLIRRLGRRPIRGEEYSALVVEMLQPAKYIAKGKPLVMDRRDEPNIRQPTEIVSLFRKLGMVPSADFVNAVSLSYQVFHEIKFCRHYYAHRNRDTYFELRRNSAPLAAGIVKNPDEMLHYRGGRSSVPKFSEWTHEVKTFFEVAVP